MSFEEIDGDDDFLEEFTCLFLLSHMISLACAIT